MINAADLLLEHFSVPQDDLKKAQSYIDRYGGNLEHTLVNMGSLSEDNLPQFYAKLFEVEIITLSDLTDWQAVEGIVESEIDFFSQRNWLPFKKDDENRITFATDNPFNMQVGQYVAKRYPHHNIVIADSTALEHLSNGYNKQDTEVYGDDAYLTDAEEGKLRELATEAPTVNLLNSLIARALRQGASDMHLEPYLGKFRVRYRVDGVLHEVDALPPRMELPITTRLKILSGMDIAEKRRPQDGKIEMKISNIELDIRVSALPLNKGESIVMRFLRKDAVKYDMAVLGLSDDVETALLEDLTSTAGVVLMTGPTGSGKTTSLYTFLNKLNNDAVKIITLEDPVEYQLDGINQVQVKSDIGFDFSAGLRSIVRQDPDIIMLGEIRDAETARIAMQSALTGHLVFSTVHTNDAPSAYTRLLDLGVEEFLLNAALVSIIAQRLGRKICPHCSIDHPDKAALAQKYELQSLADRFNSGQIDLKTSTGCDECGHTGYKGRMAIIEYLRCDDKIQEIRKDHNFIPLARKYNQSQGFRTLLDDGLLKAIRGETRISEVIRVAG